MQKFWNFLKAYWAIFILVGFVIAVFFSSFKPGLWLLGWDSLVPEFNFSLNIQRDFFSGWQEYQGLGLAGGMAHGASLSRDLMLWSLSALLPMQYVRSFWTLAMLIIGPIGMYFIAGYFFTPPKQKQSALAGLIVGGFYLFNLATLQYFYPPFETFSSFYGFFPWLILVGLRFLEFGGWKRIATLLAVSILSTSTFQVQTLFVTYMFVMGVFLLEMFLRGDWQVKRRCLFWILIQIVVNLHWLFPVGYFTLTQSQTNLQAQQNVLATPELKVMNQNYGDWQHITAFQGYWFDYMDKDASFKRQYLLATWKNYLADERLLWIERGFFLTGLVGLFWLAKSRFKTSLSVSISVLAVLVPLTLTAGSGASGKLYLLAETYIPLFSQVFRTTFTKWSMIMAFLVSLGVGFIYLKISAKLFSWVKLLLAGVILAGMILVVWPFFKGELISKQMQVAFPAEYLRLFEFFKSQPKQTRIALLPAQSIWGWEFDKWGYGGSGYLWYGIEQPLLSRTFDVYSPFDENFYHQFSTALKSGLAKNISNVLTKYQVGYILVDESVLLNKPENNVYLTYPELLAAAGFEPIWKANFLTVYAAKALPVGFVQPANGEVQFVKTPDLFQAKKTAFDSSKLIAADLSSDIQAEIFPFADLLANKLKRYSFSDERLELKSDLKTGQAQDHILTLPALNSGENLVVPVKITFVEKNLNLEFLPIGEFDMGMQSRPLYKLPNQQIPLVNAAASRVTLELNDQILIGDSQNSTVQYVQLKIGAPIDFKLTEIYQTNQPSGNFKSGKSRNLSLGENIWQEVLSETSQVIKLDNSSELKLKFSVQPVDILAEFKKIEMNQYCDIFKRGQAQKLVLENGSLVYKSVDAGVACASLELADVNVSASYFMEFKGQNISGRSPKILVSSLSDNYYYLEELLSQKTFTNAYLLAPFGEKPDRFFINLEIKSFGRDISEARFDSIQLAQLPVSNLKLAQISLRPANYQSVVSSVELSSAQKWSTWLYSGLVKVKSNPGAIVLNQGHDAGWVMVILSDTLVWPAHFLANDWANGWLVSQGNYKYLIFYWPQLGVFAGYLVLVFTVIWVGVKKFSVKKPR